MLARAARRKVHPRAVSYAQAHERLALPWLCPALLQRSSHTNSTTTPVLSQPSEPRRALRRSQSPRRSTRSLATATDLIPEPSNHFDPYMQAWKPPYRSPELGRLQPWNVSDLLVVHESIAEPTKLSNHRPSFSMAGNPIELHQNLYASLRVGRIERASAILSRLSSVFAKDAPELVDSHNIYFQSLLELAMQDPQPDSMQKLEKWYTKTMRARGVPPSPQTFVTLLRGVMNFLPNEERQDAIRKYMSMAQEYGEDFVDDINYSPEFTDEEWDTLLRAQPDTYAQPPSVDEVQDMLVNAPAFRKELIDHGLATDFKKIIKPVSQKGVGLDTLKMALALFDDPKTLEYPHDMQGTKEEKDQAYAHMRQLRLEADASDAAVARWKAEHAKLEEAGIHGVMGSKPIQALMYNWYTDLVPIFKKQIAYCKKLMTDNDAKTASDPAHAYGPWLERCKPEKLAAITIARCVQACILIEDDRDHNGKIAKLSMKIGTDIQDYLNADAQTRREAFLKKQRKELRHHLATQLQRPEAREAAKDRSVLPRPALLASMMKTRITVDARVRLGAFAIESILQTANLTIVANDPKTGEQLQSVQSAFQHSIDFVNGKKTGFIVPHPHLLTKLRKEPVSPVEPMRLPMIVEPKPWTSFDDGGFYTISQGVVRTRGDDPSQRAYAESAIEHGDMKQTLAALDVLGKVPWQINKDVLSVMADAWNGDETIGGLKSQHLTVQPPEQPPADCNYKDRLQYGKALQQYQNLKDGTHSQRCFINFQLETARAFADEPQLFFPHNVDFRGRAYPVPPLLNHMGADVARGLLKFARRKELGTVGLQWLKIHLANLYGYDKASLKEREEFAMDNIAEIYDSATNPLDGRRWWTKAEDPWQCLACCFELRNAFDAPDPTRYMSSLPVHQDGTCNGLQHYAALGGDHAGARQVNLEPSDRPQDIYTGVAELVKEMVAEDAKEGQPCAKFIDGYITRKVVKRTVMTNVYGVTFMGAKAQVLDELRDVFPMFKPTGGVRSLDTVALYVAHQIFAALGKIFNGAQEIQYWLGECGDRITTSLTAEQIEMIEQRFEGAQAKYDAKFKTPKAVLKTELAKLAKAAETFRTSIIWTTPLKMPVVQPYRKDSLQAIKTKLQEITVTKRSPSDTIDKRKQLQAFPPNFIHSLDATHMTLSALKCAEVGLDFAAVHDSFWTHACDIPNLNVILRDAFVRMHSEDIVGRLAEEFKARYAGAMYLAHITSLTDVGAKIKDWRITYYRSTGRRVTNTASARGSATIEELALEQKRLRLLKSENPEEVEEGKAMVTPTSIWLESNDPTALSSFRMAVLGDTDKKKESKAGRDKPIVHEADIIAQDDESPTLPDAAIDSVDASTAPEQDLAESQPSRGRSRKGSRVAVPQQESLLTVWIPLTFPPTPKKGGWDVSRLRESRYFFS
ncbi:DNA-directed RNA polymerase mitochondrial precursor [Phaeosphaeria sp. MPI-PUGE-AT-0046c]|nr:DNA-directed RNA polymerase mitochondrial precursor [Phaeosphaeria sp. MPI-PUGE-AT-0046c]